MRLIFTILLFTTMLKTTFIFIKHHETDYNRKQTLIKTITNAEKLARTRERSKFLVACRRKCVIPKFIQRKTKTVSDIFPHSKRIESIQINYMRKLLNEAIKMTFKTEAFLMREQQRLAKARQVERHPLVNSACLSCLAMYCFALCVTVYSI